jgi:membrane protein implicated in regulation of membrane protease activity
VSRAGEHRVVRATYVGPRVALLAVAVTALAAAAALAFDLGHDEVRWTWAAAAVVSVLATVALARFWKMSRPIVRGGP